MESTEITQEMPQEDKKVIVHNIDLLKWYFNKDKSILQEQQKERAFAIMSLASMEDPFIFMRILLYICNTRKTDEQELVYKTIIHFACIMYPDWMFNNIHHFTRLGKKEDVLYFLQVPSIAERVVKYVNHLAKEDEYYASLVQGNYVKTKIKRIVRYVPKLKRKDGLVVFLHKILDDPTFNGIAL